MQCRGSRREREREQTGRQEAIKQSLCIDAAAAATGGRRKRTRSLARSFNAGLHSDEDDDDDDDESVLSMNDGRIDHNFRRRESIRGSADSAGRQAGRQKKAIAKRAGKLKR